MKERTAPNLPLGDIEDSVKWSSMFPGGMMARGQFSEETPSQDSCNTQRER